MPYTRATKERRLASLDADIAEAQRIATSLRERAKARDAEADRLKTERDWLAQAPVADPLPEPDEAAGGDA